MQPAALLFTILAATTAATSPKAVVKRMAQAAGDMPGIDMGKGGEIMPGMDMGKGGARDKGGEMGNMNMTGPMGDGMMSNGSIGGAGSLSPALVVALGAAGLAALVA